MAVRSEERTEFLRDIITTAVEGGTGYWAQVSQYQWVDDAGQARVVCGERVGDDARAVLHPLTDDETGYEKEGRVVDLDLIAKGIGLIERELHLVRSDLRDLILLASRENDAGLLDADAADVIVQAGLFEEVVYG